MSTPRLTSKTVLILDEAGMLDTKTLSRIVRLVEKADATLILTGDWKQLPPINAGGPMARIARELGQAELRENQRQRRKEDRQAVKQIREGKVREALEAYAQRGQITVTPDRDATKLAVVDHWEKSGGVTNPKHHLIFTETRADAQEINKRCQDRRLQKGTCDPKRSVRINGHKYHPGDRVLFHEANRLWGIENGFRGSVLSVDAKKRTITIQLDNELSATSKARKLTQVATIPLEKLDGGKIGLGYAATTHKMQGQTIAYAYLLLGTKMTSKEMLYVQATRSKERTHIFIDEGGAGEKISELIRTTSKSSEKNLAHDLRRRQDTVPPKRSVGPSNPPQQTQSNISHAR